MTQQMFSTLIRSLETPGGKIYPHCQCYHQPIAKYINPHTDFDLANLTPEQGDEYEQSRLSYYEMKEVVNTAEMDGIRKGKIEIAKQMKAAGEPKEKIKKYTGQIDSEIDRL